MLSPSKEGSFLDTGCLMQPREARMSVTGEATCVFLHNHYEKERHLRALYGVAHIDKSLGNSHHPSLSLCSEFKYTHTD